MKLLILISILFLPCSAFAESPRAKLHDSEKNDFGAETIEDGEFGTLSPLPPELVEEREVAENQKSTEQKSTTETKKETGDGSAKLNLSKEDEQQIKNALNGNDIEIAALIKTFSKLLKRNFITDSSVKGKVTIHLPTPVTTKEALQVFDTVLLLKGFTAVPVTHDTWKIIAARDAKQTTVPLIRKNSDAPTDQLVTEKIKLKYIASSEAQDLLNAFISKDGTLKAVEGSNSLILIDSQANIVRLKELLDEVDVPAVDREISVIPVHHAEATDVAEKINNILGSNDDKDKQGQAAAGNLYPGQLIRPPNPALTRPTGSPNDPNQSSNTDKRSIPFKIIPDERTNSIIAVADSQMILKVQALVEQLDSEVDRSGGRFWVYRLKHADAETLADILSNLISGSSGSSGTSGQKTQGSSISRSNNSGGSSFGRGGRSNSRSGSNTGGAFGNGPQALSAGSNNSSSGGGKVNFEGEVSVTADPATNSLLINATRTDYLRVKEVINELDIKRRQVLVEATLLEVRISDQKGLGVELQGTAGLDKSGIFGQSNFGNITNLLTNPAALTDITIAAASTGSLTLPGGITIPSQAVLISAVSKNSNVNVLSSPTILATDNEEAEIIVGENVPFVSSTGTNTTNIANTFNQVQRQDVGITLRITPQISTGDYVNLHMFVEISSVVEGTRNDANGPTTTIRTTETSVEVKDSQMVITGGLIQDQVEESTRGFPFVEDIPVVGELFKREDNRNVKTNLLVFITPKVIKDQFDARDHSRSHAKSLSDEIETKNINPKRHDILDSPALDNVAETYNGKVEQPSTIIPPKADISGDLPALSEQNEEKVINLSVTPKLPNLGNEITSNVEKVDTPQNVVGDLPAAKVATDGSIAVLRKISGDVGNLKYARDSQTIAVDSADKYFHVGERYKHKDSQTFICLGVYSNREKLSKTHPELVDVTLKNNFVASNWMKQ